MRPPQHDKTHPCADRNQDQRHERQQRREQERNDDLRADDDHRRGELHHVVGRRADAENVAAHQVGDARVLQARDHRPGRGGQSIGESGADGFDKPDLDPRQHDIAAGNDNGPDDHDCGEQAEQQRQA